MSQDSLLSRLLQGRAKAGPDLKVHLSERDGPSLHDKMRQAYWWITNNAVICPYYDIEYGAGTSLENRPGRRAPAARRDELQLLRPDPAADPVHLPARAAHRRPGARQDHLGDPDGAPRRHEPRRGAALDPARPPAARPSPTCSAPRCRPTCMKAEDMSAIKIAWRKWIGERVKIIDEYNRIPTKTQSALLSLMADGYAEMFDQYVYEGRSSWFLTANDDAGGGTFQVIEALKDRIDVVVARALQLPLPRARCCGGSRPTRRPRRWCPAEIVFTAEELERDLRRDPRGHGARRRCCDRLGFFLGQLDFCRMASPRFEDKNKDTLKLAGKTRRPGLQRAVPARQEGPPVHPDRERRLGARLPDRASTSPRRWPTSAATPRSRSTTCARSCPGCCTRSSCPTRGAPSSRRRTSRALLQDRVAWIRSMFDMAMEQHGRHEPVRRKVRALRRRARPGPAGRRRRPVPRAPAAQVPSLLEQLDDRSPSCSGAVYEDIIHLKSIYSRYQNYAHWLKENRRR